MRSSGIKSLVLVVCLLSGLGLTAQEDLLMPPDTLSPEQSMNMDAVYDRPFMKIGRSPVSLGGYVEADYQYIGEDGITEGHTFRIPRMTLFVASSISSRIKFLSEIELEEGGKEIAIEFAAVDLSVHSLLNFRGGVIMNPIGAFNQNHDGPKWEFVDRPIPMTEMLPATWSNPGFGIFGKTNRKNWAMGYELYLTNGFDGSIIDNALNRTFLPATKSTGERFEESSNGQPMITGKVSFSNRQVGEIGFSYMGGIFNKYQDDGLILDDKRRVNVLAIDFNTTIPGTGTRLVGEWAWVSVDVPVTFTQQFGDKQHGGFLDIVQPVLKGDVLSFKDATLNLACRLEYVDWNVGTFRETNGDIGDHLWAIVPAVSFRPTPETVIRLNYRVMRQTDILGNPPTHIGGVQFGLATYF